MASLTSHVVMDDIILKPKEQKRQDTDRTNIADKRERKWRWPANQRIWGCSKTWAPAA